MEVNVDTKVILLNIHKLVRHYFEPVRTQQDSDGALTVYSEREIADRKLRKVLVLFLKKALGLQVERDPKNSANLVTRDGKGEILTVKTIAFSDANSLHCRYIFIE